MQINLPALLLLKRISAKKAAQDNLAANNSHTSSTETKSRKTRFTDWLSPKPDVIKLFPGETEIFRQGLVLVTDTRLAYIDPFDRMLKTFMFEHMISLHKHFYQSTVFNRRLCKALLFIALLVFLIIVTIDLLDSKSSGFFLVYLPLLASILLGIKVWNDMKPWYVIHWRMRDNTYGEIVQEPMFRERIRGNNKREVFMNDLANAMNQALSAKAWWPGRNHESDQLLSGNRHPIHDIHSDQHTSVSSSGNQEQTKTPLKLVTDNYQ